MAKRLIYVLLIISMCFCSVEAVSQDIFLHGISKKNLKHNQNRLDSSFSNYSIFEYQSTESLKSVSNKGQIEIGLTIDEYFNGSISLTETSLLSEDYYSSKAKDTNSPKFKTYQGKILGDPSSQLRVSILDGVLYGYIESSDQKLWIESATTFDNRLSPNTMVAYLSKNIIVNHQKQCAATQVSQRTSKISSQTKMATSCKEVALAIAMDYSFVTNPSHNSYQSAVNQSIHIMNLVEGSFLNQFDAEIRFKIVEHFAPSSQTESDNLWGAGSNISVLLNNFSSWGPTGFNNTHDIGQFWTVKNVYSLIDPAVNDIPSNRNFGVCGLAWISAVCTNLRYHLIGSSSTNDALLRSITAHELGHNFGALHDADPRYIMNAVVGDTEIWSPASIVAFNDSISNYTCIEECILSSCSEITNVRVYGCNSGSIPTYQLDITITHNGGGTSSGCNVNIGSASFPFTWTESPQVITIHNLTADGSMDKQVSIIANDLSDAGCGGTANYNVPDGNCSLSISEDFNDCNIPEGWISLTTNEPQNYSWGFGDSSRTIYNYGNYENASTSKTLDGSCMVYMDDELFTNWSGVATLVSPVVEDFESLNLNVDYIFNRFEGIKLNNNSYFKINVWDGAQYVNLVTDTNDSCPWNNVWQTQCIPSVDIELTSYLNDSLHITFVYSDVNSEAGMAVFDNFSLSGKLKTQSSSCPTVITLNPSLSSGTLLAKEAIVTTRNFNISGTTLLNAPEVYFYGDLVVPVNVEITVINDGCKNNSN
ncbi:MAG: hypothetical protein ACJA01_004496 [Saprospiraceae bacterium]|jgi:hypothetical protein